MMEMIREVKSELVIVSFAVYDNSAIVPEMEKAVTNSVALTVVVETLNPARERLPLVRYDFHRFDQNKYLYP